MPKVGVFTNHNMGSKKLKKYCCTLCRRRFVSENAVWTHISFKHPGYTETTPIELECCDCKQVYSTESDLDKHVIEHHPNNLTVAESPSEISFSSLNSDISSKCKTYKYFCSICKKKCATENAIWTHVTFQHVGQLDNFSAQYICDTCKLVFISKEQFELHSNELKQHDGINSFHVKEHITEILDDGVTKLRLNPVNKQLESRDLDCHHNDDSSVKCDMTNDHIHNEQEYENDGNKGNAESDSSDDVSITGLLDEDVQGQIILLSTMLTNELLEHRVSFLEDKVHELQTYMHNLVDGLLLEAVDPCVVTNEVSPSSVNDSLGNLVDNDSIVFKDEDGLMDMYMEPLLAKNEDTACLDALIFTKLKSSETEVGVVEEVVEDSRSLFLDTPLDETGSKLEENFTETRTRRRLLRNRTLPVQEIELPECNRKRSTSRNYQATA